jgi:arabinogalactan oligomer/maltooligosaccharide transport system permease protein
MFRMPPTPPTRVAAALALLGVIVLATCPAVSGLPAPPTGLTATPEGEFTVNITFRPSPSADIGAYRIYASSVNRSTVAELLPPPGFSQTLYDTIHTTAPGNISRIQPALDAQWFWFQNATQSEWTLGYGSVFEEIVPSDATALAYRLTGFTESAKANETVWVAVTAVDLGDIENPSVSAVPAVPAAQVIPEKPHNEGIYLTWGLIIAAVLVAVALVARYEARKNRAAYFYILPPLVGLVALTFYPVIFGFFISFTSRTATQNPTFDFVGAANYLRVFAQPDLVMVATTTFVWTVVNVALHVSIGLFLAVLLNRKLRGRVVYRAVLLLPWAVPSYITTLAWRGMFEPSQGLVNALLGPTGWQLLGCSGPCQWLTATSSPLPLIAVIITNVWLGFPFMMMVFSGALQGIPPELYEAADVDGVSGWRKFRHITLPLLKPSIVPASLLGFIWTFNMFNVIYLMTQGRPPVPGMRAGATDILITYVYRVGFAPFWEQGFAAAYSVVIFFMLLGFGLFYTKYTGAMEAFAGGTAAQRGPKHAASGFIGSRVTALRGAWDRRFASPIRSALNPDQLEHIQSPVALTLALGVSGVLEIAFGVAVLESMTFWNIVSVVAGTWFVVVGLGFILGGIGLGMHQRAGRRVAGWSVLLELVGACFVLVFGVVYPLLLFGAAARWDTGLVFEGWLTIVRIPIVMLGFVPVMLFAHLRLPIALVLLRQVAQPVREYTGPPDAWSRLVDRLAARWTKRFAHTSMHWGSRRWVNIPVHVFLIVFSFVTIIPILAVVGTAFGERAAGVTLVNTPLLRELLLPGQPLPGWTLDHFGAILSGPEFTTWLKNSLIVSGGTTAVGLLLATTGAYGFSRFAFRGKRWSMLSFIIVQMFPGAIILIPYYVLMDQLGLINQLVGLVIMYSVTALPFVLWFLKGFFDTIPVDLEEAAMVDGTTRLGALWRVIMPLAVPAIAVAALFSFLSAWNEWLLAYTFMQSSANYTLPVGVNSFVPIGGGTQSDWGSFAAISVLVSIPVAVLFVVFQKYLVSGLTKGAVKG